jgi:hypothetical protein
MKKYFNFNVLAMAMLTMCINLSSCSKDEEEDEKGMEVLKVSGDLTMMFNGTEYSIQYEDEYIEVLNCLIVEETFNEFTNDDEKYFDNYMQLLMPNPVKENSNTYWTIKLQGHLEKGKNLTMPDYFGGNTGKKIILWFDDGYNVECTYESGNIEVLKSDHVQYKHSDNVYRHTYVNSIKFNNYTLHVNKDTSVKIIFNGTINIGTIFHNY